MGNGKLGNDKLGNGKLGKENWVTENWITSITEDFKKSVTENSVILTKQENSVTIKYKSTEN